MGRIKKVATERHTATLSDATADFVREATATPLHQLPKKLASFPQQWPFPRGDLYHWIPLLDRFDHLLDLFNTEYGLKDGPQHQPFGRRLLVKGDGEEGQPWPSHGAKEDTIDDTGFSAEGDRELIQSVLHFTRILLEHCGNRSLYASSSHLNDLLHTTSLSLLRLCLKLSLRLAQRYQVARFKNNLPQAQHTLLTNHYAFNLDNLHKLAMPFPKPAAANSGGAFSTPSKPKEKFHQSQPFNPNDLVLIAKDPHALFSNAAISSVTLVYYDKKTLAPSTASFAENVDTTPATPTPVRRSSNLGPSHSRPSPAEQNLISNDTPTKSKETDPASSNTSQAFQISSTKVSELSSWELVRDSIPLVPQDAHYDLLNRIRIAKALSTPEQHAQELVEIRLLAIANLYYALNESRIQEKIGIPDSEEPRRFSLAQQLCDLLQPPMTGQKPLDTPFETTVLLTIEALSKSRHKISEVADALSVSVNHGVLYYELRKMIGSLNAKPFTDPDAELHASEWRDATCDLIHSLQQANVQARYGERMVAAGVMDIMVEVLALRTTRAERLHEKILSFFTSFFHNIPSAFETLAASKGLDVIADLCQYGVNAAMENAREGNGLPANYRSKVIDYQIPFYLQSTLRQLFKFAVHLFEHSAGQHDRLIRNFIDTPQILESLKTVIENADVFGSNVWSGALNIVSCFIHNEPTCYQVISEAGLSKSILEAVTGDALPDELPKAVTFTDDELPTEIAFVNGEPDFPSIPGILPVGETMADIPAAFGALCLNETGMLTFQASKALIKYFDIFVSPAHVRVFEDEATTAHAIGSSFDELSRHHPRLKEQISAAVLSMVKRVASLCRGLAEHKCVGAKLWQKSEHDGRWYISGGRAAMAGHSHESSSEIVSQPNTAGAAVFTTDIHLQEREDASALPYLSACFKFLEGLFHNSSIATAFCSQGGVEYLLDLATSPSNPYDLVAFSVFGKISQVLKTLCENKAHLVLPSILHRAQKTLHALHPILDSDRREGAFAEYTGISHEHDSPQVQAGTVIIKALSHAHLYADILSRTLAPPHYPSRHNSQTNLLFTALNFTDIYVDLVEEFSKLHASSIWENLALQKYLSQETKERSDPKPFITRRVDAQGFVEIGVDARSSEGSDTKAVILDKSDDPLADDVLISKNVKAIRFLFSQTPASIEGFFRSLGQALVPKRTNDIYLKAHAALVAERLAKCAIWEMSYQKYGSVDETMHLKYTWGVLCAVTHIMLRNSFSMEAYNHKEAITSVLNKFYVNGGFTKLNEFAATFSDVFKTKDRSGSDEQAELAAREGLKTILDFYGNVARSKCIIEAAQSNTLSVTNHKQADYFMPGQFVVEIRDAILPAVSKLWSSSSIDNVGDHHAKQVIEILRIILRGEGEDRALKKSDRASRRVAINKPDFSLRNSTLVPVLQSEEGFEIPAAREALYRCHNHLQNATEYGQLRQLRQLAYPAPSFPIPDDENSSQQSSSTAHQLNKSSSQQSVNMEDAADERNATAQADTGTDLSSEADIMSDVSDDNPLGLPVNMSELDLLTMVGNRRLQEYLTSAPAAGSSARSSGPPAEDTHQPFITMEDLDEKRITLRSKLIDRCLEVLSAVPNVTFELADLIHAAVAKSGEGANPRANIGSTLVSSLFSLQGEEDSGEAGVKISAYAHLVALILQDRDFFDSTLDELKECFSTLVAWVRLEPGKKPEDAPWMEMILLIIERVLAEDEQPVSLTWDPPPADDPLRALPSPEPQTIVVSDDLRTQLFDALLDILPKIGKNRTLALSVTRVLVILTRRTSMTERLRQRSSMSRLFVMIRQMAGSIDEKLQSAFMVILRHLVEDPDTIRKIMRTEIKAAFENHRSSRGMDTATYTRNLYHLVLRAPDLFVEVTQEMLEVSRFDGNPNRPQQLALKKSIFDLSTDQPKSQQLDAQPSVENESCDTPKLVDSKFPTIDYADGVIAYLLRELSNYKDVEDRTPTPTETKDSEAAGDQNNKASSADAVDASMPDATDSPANIDETKPEEVKSEKPSFKPEDHPIFVYRCFLLQCLSELLASYTKTKVEFINFSRKPEATPATPSKPRAGTLNYLLNVLIPLGTLDHKDETAHRKKQATSYWAQMVLVALSAKTQEKHLSSDSPSTEEPELGFVRKFVVEHAIRSFKEAILSTDSLDHRYSKLLGLGELFNRMLHSKVDRANAPSGDENFAPDIGKIMYERGIISALTSALAEIDLNFPNAKRAVKYILGPLKKLTQLGVDCESLRSSSSSSDGVDDDDISSASSISGEEDEDEREQTPDLLRNTTLGILESGGGEEESESGSDDEDEEMYDDYGEEMEYEEEAIAEHGDVVSDEDEDVDGIGHIEGLSGDVDMDVEIVMDGENDDSEDDDDDDDTSEDDDDGEEEGDDDDLTEFGEILDEITADDENASGDGNDDEGDWEEDGIVEFEGEHDIDDGVSHHRDPLEHIAHVLGADEHSDAGDVDGVVRIDMGGGDEEFFEDEMAPDDAEEEDDEGDYENDVIYEPELEEEDEDGHDMAWNWDAPPPPTIIHRHHHHAGLPRGFNARGFHEMFGMIGGDFFRPPNFRTHRTASTSRGEEDGVNPLLQRDGHIDMQQRMRESQAESILTRIRRRAFAPHGNAGREQATFISGAPGENFIQNLITAVGTPSGPNGGTINVSTLPPVFSVSGRPGGHALIDINPGRPWRDQFSVPFWNGRGDARASLGTDEAQAVHFTPTTTIARWQEEARMLYGGKHHEKATRVINTLMRLLVPAAMEIKRLADRAKAERDAEEARVRDEEQKKAEAEKMEREVREKQEKEEREAEDAARRAQDENEINQEAGEMEGLEQDRGDFQGNEPAMSEPARERITTTIRGREIDITTLGIDREYLEALPEEMREEVIMQQFQEQRSQAERSGEQPTEISREFLEALPREIQAELLRQEAADRRRREREEARRASQQAGNSQPAQPEEMNNADFIAMLDPGLRQAVLMDADENTLASLPEDLQAEARALIGDRQPRGHQVQISRRLEEHVTERQADTNSSEEKKHRKPVAQMLDKAGVATLLRLLFVTMPQKAKANLQGILSHACKNTQNRAEVISILLSILQDGTADVGAVERSFAHLSLKAKQAGPKTPQPLKRALSGPISLNPGAELSPLNIVHHCLTLLNALAHDNPRVPSFFLNEHETSASQKAKAYKKGKGRENRATKYPLNALLMLLDRKLITENTGVMEVLASLLSRVTQPLVILLRRAREAQESENKAPGPNEEERPSTSSDVAMAEATRESTRAVNEEKITRGDAAATADSNNEKKPHKQLSPPEVPEENIRLVVNILAARECPSKTFSDTLDIIKNLSAVPGAKEAFGRELVRQAQELGQTVVQDLEELAIQIEGAKSGTDLQGMALANFSSAGSKQRKLLRVLLALDHLFDPKRMAQSPNMPSPIDPKVKYDVLALLYDSATFDKLWSNLSLCLAGIRRRGNMVNVATVLLPLIESFMVVCRNTALKEAAPTTIATTPALEMNVSSPPPESRIEGLFYQFTEDNRKILNELIRNNPKLLSGHLSILAKNSKVLEFDNKRVYFNRKLHHRGEGRMAHPNLQLNVRRGQVFLDSFKSLYYKSGDEIKYGKLNIRFSGEEGIDAGGVSREWFAAMARQMFNPDYALFNPVASDRTTFHPNPLSDVNEEHLMFFKFIGRIIGKALYEGRVLDCYFSRAVYRRILGKSVSLKDMESLDLDYYKSLVWILENDITDVTFETFSVDISRFGDTETIDLIENGRNIPVTEENKAEYVRLVVEHRLIKSVEDQLNNFLAGFHEIISPELIAIFNEQELELLISGLPDIDVDDWKNNTEYQNYQATSPQIQWFWRAVRSFDKEEKAKLLQFVTGTSKVPLNGFKELEGMNGFSKFSIHRDYSSKEKLPSSHTCFNQLDLPEYESYEHLRQQLYTAITAGSEYFGFA